MSKNVPKNIVWACFDWFFRRRKALPSAPWRLKKILENRKTFNFSKMSKTDTKSVQTSFEVIFSKFFIQCTLEGREVEKHRTNGGKFKFSKSRTFLKVSKFVLRWFFSEFLMTSAPGRSKLVKIRKKIEKNLKFQKSPKTFLKVSKQVSRWFFWVFLFIAPWRVEKSKNIKKMEKNSNFQNPENVSKRVQICFEVTFFQISYDQCTLEIKTCKNSRRNIKKFEFSETSKNVPKIVQTSFQLVLR